MSWLTKKKDIASILNQQGFIELDQLNVEEAPISYSSKGFTIRLDNIKAIEETNCFLNKFLRVIITLSFTPVSTYEYDTYITDILNIMEALKTEHDGFYQDTTLERVETSEPYYYQCKIYITVNDGN